VLEDSSLPGKNAKWKDRLVCKFRVFAIKIRNNNPEKDLNLDMSLLFVLVGVPTSVVYILFQVYILVKDIIALRALLVDI
jgi:hypothetical protein